MLLLLLATLDCRDCRNITRRIILTGLCLSTAAYVIILSPESVSAPDGLRYAAHILHSPNMLFAWLFGLLLFEDDFKFQRKHIIISVLYAVPALIICGLDAPHNHDNPNAAIMALSLFGIGLMMHLVYKIASGYRDDLIIRRRRVRLLFVMTLVFVTVVLSIDHMRLLPLPEAFMSWFQIVAIFGLTVWAFLWLTRFDEDEMFFRFKPATVPAPNHATLEPRDEALKNRLLNMMESDSIYLEQGLTIRALADKIKAPEHRLRNVINTGLGYRNFSAFLNDYRIRAVKQALAEPDNAHLPILTLAMDHGYNSLAPFNRAFREAEDMTPSEYRQSLIQTS